MDTDKERIRKNLFNTSMCCTGLDFKHPAWSVENYSKNPYEVNKYSFNNGVFAFVDEYGDTYITPYSIGIESTLKYLGFTEGSVNAPMSNGEEIVNNDSFARRWNSLKEIAQREGRYDPNEYRQKLIDTDIKSISSEKGIKPLSENIYDFVIDADSLSMSVEGSDEVKKLPESFLKYDEILRTTNTGTYNVVNGVVSFINESGKSFFAPLTPYIEKQLKDAGYTIDDKLDVPMSNGEKIVNDNVISRRFDRLKEISKRYFENKKYERMYILSTGEYNELENGYRSLTAQSENDKWSIKSAQSFLDKNLREFRELEKIYNELVSGVESKKIVSASSLKSIIDKHGTFVEGKFELYPSKEENIEYERFEEPKKEEKTEKIATNDDERRVQIMQSKLSEIAKRHHIESLDSDTYDWLIDTDGLETNRGEKVQGQLQFDVHTMTSNIGTYTTNNGTVVVVDTDGKTYCGPYNNYLITKLKSKNFRDSERLFVPFSNGESIANNPEQEEKMDKLREISSRVRNLEVYASNVCKDRLECEYVGISETYTELKEKCDKEAAKHKFASQKMKSLYKKGHLVQSESRNYYYMIERLAEKVLKSPVVTSNKVMNSMNNHDLKTEEELVLDSEDMSL